VLTQLIGVRLAGKIERLNSTVLRLAQHLVPPCVLQPQIHFHSGRVLQYLQSLLLLLGLLILDFLDDLVIDFVLAALSITPAVGIRLRIARFFTYVPNGGLARLARQRNLLALIHNLIPLSSPQTTTATERLRNLVVGGLLLVVGLVSMLSHSAISHRFLTVIPTYKPVDYSNSGSTRPNGSMQKGRAGLCCSRPYRTDCAVLDGPTVLWASWGLTLITVYSGCGAHRPLR
jgi:hypothetical protein